MRPSCAAASRTSPASARCPSRPPASPTSGRSTGPSPTTYVVVAARCSPPPRSRACASPPMRSLLETTGGPVHARHVVFCAGVQSDRMARLAGIEPDFRIIPFRGEYYDVVRQKADLVRHLIYPVPDPDLPFLGVHLTRTVDGGLNVGPNAVLGLAREKYPKFSFDRRDALDLVRFPGMWRLAREHARTGLRELRNSASKRAYLRLCQRYCPRTHAGRHLPAGEAGIRAQAVMRDGSPSTTSCSAAPRGPSTSSTHRRPPPRRPSRSARRRPAASRSRPGRLHDLSPGRTLSGADRVECRGARDLPLRRGRGLGARCRRWTSTPTSTPSSRCTTGTSPSVGT